MDRLALLEAQLRPAESIQRIAQLAAENTESNAVLLIAQELGCSTRAARQVWCTPLRMFGPESIERAKAEAAELRRSNPTALDQRTQ